MSRPGRRRRFAAVGIAGLLWLMRPELLRAAEPSTVDELNLLLRAGRFPEAESGARTLLPIVEGRAGAQSVDVAMVIDVLVEALLDEGRSTSHETRALAERAVAIKEQALGSEHIEVARSLTQLASVNFDSGDYATERAIDRRVLAIQEKALGPDHPTVARTLYNLAFSFHTTGEYDSARPLAERSLSIMEKALGPDHPSVAYALNMLAAIDDATGEYAKEVPLLERALAIQEKAIGPGHPDLALSLINLATAHRMMGEDETSRGLVERAIAIQEKVLGPDHPILAKSLKDLASVLRDEGDYASARRLVERAIAIQEKALGPDHADLAFTISNLADLSIDTGDFPAARTEYERAIAILEKALGPEHPEVATNLAGLATAFAVQGDYASARPLYERAQTIWEKAFGPEHPLVGANLISMAALSSHLGDDTRARALFERGVAIQEKTLGADHPEVARSLDSFAAMLQAAGRAAEARPLVERAVAIDTKSFGADHPERGASLSLLANVEAGQGESAQALDHAIEAERIGRQHLQLTSRSFSEQQALRYAAVRSSGLDLALTLAAGGVDAPSRRRVLDALVRSRAVVLDEMAARHRATIGAADPKLAALAADLTRARERYAHLAVRGLGDQQPAIYARLLDTAREDEENAERRLAEASAGFARQASRTRLGLDEVAAALPAGSALVAFTEYSRIDVAPRAGTTAGRPQRHDGVRSFLAFVLRAGEDGPSVVDLGPAGAIDDVVASWMKEASGGALRAGRSPRQAEAAYREVGTALRRRVWDPLAPAIAGVDRVFVVPDGTLNLVNVAALPTADGGYLVEHGPLVHHVSAERDLVLPAEPRHGEGLLALGSPDFDAPTRPGGETARRVAPATPPHASGAEPPVTIASAAAYRGQRSACGDFASVRFTPLPATGRETRELVALWEKYGDGQPVTPSAVLDLRAAAATEATLKRAAPGRRVLHLATHGFFLGGGCRSALDETRGIGGLSKPPAAAVTEGPPPPASGENPLLLSGLVLAGANHRAATDDTEDDGILTAEEIASLDLTGVDWAVLSACETGVGVVRAGEGVLGLRRAFQVSGVGTLIMSLWSVDDEATRSWMKALYEGRLAAHLQTAEAVRHASLKILADRRARKLSTHPFYWAAFIAAGDWR